MGLLGQKFFAPSDAGEQCLRFNVELLHCFPELTIVKLRPETKRPTQSFAKARENSKKWDLNTRITILRSWLSQGAGVGLILLQTPLWILDLDATEGFPCIVDETIQLLQPPQVLTPSGGRHCYFRLPDDLVKHPHLKAHVCHPKVDGVRLPLDLKLGGRQTLVVASGTRRGSTKYMPLNQWSLPPILDPRELFPSVNVLHLNEGEDFDVDARSLEDRIARATQYIRTKAPICISQNQARATLSRVCSHLVQYLRLPESLALKLMTTPAGKSWNDRCQNGETGSPWPWSTQELNEYLRAAKNSVPAYGVIARKHRLYEEDRNSKLDLVCSVLSPHVSKEGTAVAVTAVYAAVMAATGMTRDICTLDRFGKFLGGRGIHRYQKGSKRVQSLVLTITLSDLTDLIREAIATRE